MSVFHGDSSDEHIIHTYISLKFVINIFTKITDQAFGSMIDDANKAILKNVSIMSIIYFDKLPVYVFIVNLWAN